MLINNRCKMHISRYKLSSLALITLGGILGLFCFVADHQVQADLTNPADGANYTDNPASDIAACGGQSECFGFTINTKLQSDGATSGTAKNYLIPLSGYVGGASNHTYSWIVNWGDGSANQTVSGTSSLTSSGISHTYTTAGAYQITIRPNGTATDGWMNAFGYYDNTSGANDYANRYKFFSIDTPFTNLMRSSNAAYRFAYIFCNVYNGIGIPSSLFSLVDTSSAADLSHMFESTFSNFALNSNNAYIPSNLFSPIQTDNATDQSYMFKKTFFAYAAKSADYNLPAGLFSSFTTNNVTDFSYMFSHTFDQGTYPYYSATTIDIPAGLFDALDTSNATDLSFMFDSTFINFARASEVATIPDGLFNSINTSNATNLEFMFYNTFSNYASSSELANIPADLFSSIVTDNATNLDHMFNYTFSNYAESSPIATIPAGLFNTINPVSASDLSGMFEYTFANYASVSTIGTIPTGLFSSINTNNATSLKSMFRCTFYGFVENSTTATIPAGLFSSLNTTNAADFSEMFRSTFENFATRSNTTIPTGLFSSINTSSATDVSSMFNYTFYGHAQESTTGTIPSGLFEYIDTSNATDLSYMFYNTFGLYAIKSTQGSIPNGLFRSIDISSAVDVEGMFYYTFSGYASNSTIGTIPTDLFNSIVIPSGMTNIDMFDSPFGDYAIRQVSFSLSGTVINSLSQTFTNPYALKIGLDGTPSDYLTVSAGDVVYPSYNNEPRSITKPSGVYASFDWFYKDGTSCADSNPTPDCGPQDSNSLASFPIEDEWTSSTSTEKASITLYNTPPPPIVDSTSPSKAFVDYPEVVTITGANFIGATEVSIGGEACMAFIVTSSTSITCYLPGIGTAGSKSVVVKTPSGSNSANSLYEVVEMYVTASSNNPSINVAPNKFSSGKSTVTVSTNNPNGYNLSMRSSSSSIAHTSTPASTIPTINSSFTPTSPASASAINNLVGNTSLWAYRVTNQDNFGNTTNQETNAASTAYSWASVPTTDQLIRVGETTDDLTTNTPQDTDVWFGASPSASQLAGQYQVTLTYTVVGDDVVPPSLIQPIQTYTQDQCQALETYYGTANGADETDKLVTLVDIRNDQRYLVGKLIDGNCWMLDNLKIANVTLSPSDTDLPADATDYTLLAAVTASDGSYDDPYIRVTDTSDIDYCNRDYSGVDVYDQLPDSNTGCGYLYNQYTATASSSPSDLFEDISANGENSSGSICPANWRLPTTLNNGSNKSDYAILNASMEYGQYTNPGVISGLSHNGWSPSGAWRGTLWEDGERAYYWSSSFSIYLAYATMWFINEDEEGSISYSYPSEMFAVRCLLR